MVYGIINLGAAVFRPVGVRRRPGGRAQLHPPVGIDHATQTQANPGGRYLPAVIIEIEVHQVTGHIGGTLILIVGYRVRPQSGTEQQPEKHPVTHCLSSFLLLLGLCALLMRIDGLLYHCPRAESGHLRPFFIKQEDCDVGVHPAQPRPVGRRADAVRFPAA